MREQCLSRGNLIVDRASGPGSEQARLRTTESLWTLPQTQPPAVVLLGRHSTIVFDWPSGGRVCSACVGDARAPGCVCVCVRSYPPPLAIETPVRGPIERPMYPISPRGPPGLYVPTAVQLQGRIFSVFARIRGEQAPAARARHLPQCGRPCPWVSQWPVGPLQFADEGWRTGRVTRPRIRYLVA